MSKYIWCSFTKNGKNVGMIFVEADDIFHVEIDDRHLPSDILAEMEKTPVNKFLTREEMEKYIPIELVPDHIQVRIKSNAKSSTNL